MGLGSRSVFPPLLASSDDAQSAQCELWVFWDFVKKQQRQKKNKILPYGIQRKMTYAF